MFFVESRALPMVDIQIDFAAGGAYDPPARAGLAGFTRSLLDAGVSEIYHLSGRSAESLFETLRQRRPDAPVEHLAYFRMAIYYAETPEPDPNRLYPASWEG